MLSRMSFSRCLTLRDEDFLEGIDGVREHLPPHPKFHGVSFNQVDARVQHVLQEVPDADEIVDAEMARFVEHDEDVNVALSSRFATRERTENAGMQNAQVAKVRAMLPQHGDRAVEIKRRFRAGVSPSTLGNAALRRICRLPHLFTIA